MMVCLGGIPSFDRAKETCGPFIGEGNSTPSFAAGDAEPSTSTEVRKRGREREQERSFSFDASIYCSLISLISRAHAWALPNRRTRPCCPIPFCKAELLGPCALDLTSEQRSAGHWQAPSKKVYHAGNNTAGDRICRRDGGVWIYSRERAFRRRGNSGRHKLCNCASGSQFTSHPSSG
jgi:hypothetical protein